MRWRRGRRAWPARAGDARRRLLRFMFYGRVSTEDWQDPVTSRARQLQQAVMLSAGHGMITAESFDTGESRTLPWTRRPQAAALVAQLADPEPGVGRDRDRGVRAGVLRESVRVDGPVVRALRRSSCGCPRWAGGWTGTPRITRRRWWRSGCRRSGRSPGPGSGCGPRWRRRRGSRAGTWAGARRTGTGSPMRGRTRTRPTRRGGGGRTGWNLIR